MEACRIQYEILRCQALEPGKISNCNALEMAFIECQGLAAWIAYVPPGLSPGATWPDLQTIDAENPDRDLILALADLVFGNRLEEQDDPRD
jgi:hypothetical protein